MFVGKSLIGLVEYMTKEDNPYVRGKSCAAFLLDRIYQDNPHVREEKIFRVVRCIKQGMDNPTQCSVEKALSTLRIDALQG